MSHLSPTISRHQNFIKCLSFNVNSTGKQKLAVVYVNYDVILRIITHLKLQNTPLNRIKNIQSFQPHSSKLAKTHATHCPLTITYNKYMFTNIK